MKAIWTSWIDRAAETLSRELEAQVIAGGSERVPPAANALCHRLSSQDGQQFVVLVRTEELMSFLGEASSGGEVDPVEAQIGPRWEALLEQIAAVCNPSMHVEQVPAPTGRPLLPYELRAGERRLTLAVVPFAAETAHVQQGVESQPAAQRAGLDLLLDVELEASLRFGSREMPLHQAMKLGPGDVLELDRHISDPVDLLVGDKIVARGEVVLVNGNFGLRVTQVAAPQKRLESIRCLF